MTNTNIGADKKPLIPSITGNPLIDTGIRIALTSGSAAVTAVILTWLNAHGFNDPNLALEVGGAVLAVMVGGATVVWSLIQTKLNQMSVVKHTVDALATGDVPDAVKVAAMKAPKISDETLNKAADNAETIKNSQ